MSDRGLALLNGRCGRCLQVAVTLCTSPATFLRFFHMHNFDLCVSFTIMLTAAFFSYCCLAYHVLAEDTGIHLPIYRRGGRFARHEPANVTALLRTLSRVEARYARTYTDINGNRIVRRWRDGPDSADDFMLDCAGQDGNW